MPENISHFKIYTFWGLAWQSSGSDFTFHAGGAGLIPGQGAKIPHALWPKEPKHKKNRGNIVTNSIKALKMVPKKSLKKNTYIYVYIYTHTFWDTSNVLFPNLDTGYMGV